jgi:hypothetical protein
MSQLRKLRRHARPPVAIDLETWPLKGVHFAAAGGLSAERIARHGNLSVEQAQALVDAYRVYWIFDEVDKPRRPTGTPYDAEDVTVTINGRRFPGEATPRTITGREPRPPEIQNFKMPADVQLQLWKMLEATAGRRP